MVRCNLFMITVLITLVSALCRSQVRLGNNSNTDGMHDSWKSNLIINLDDKYTNDSGVQQEITIKDFSFYAHQKANPVTPFIGILFFDVNQIQILAVGTTRTAANYRVGQNTFPFRDGNPAVIYLNSADNTFENGEREIYSETIVTGFLDANADGTGGEVGSVIPFDQSGSVDNIWYVGGPSGGNSASVSPFRKVKYSTTPITNLKRNYHYNIDFEIKSSIPPKVSRIEIFTEDKITLAPGQGAQIDVGLYPKDGDAGVYPNANNINLNPENFANLNRVFGSAPTGRVKFTNDNGHYLVTKYVDDTPIEVFGASAENPEMKLIATITPIPRAPVYNIEFPSKFNAVDFDYGNDGVTFHDNTMVATGELERSAVKKRFNGQGFDVTDIEIGEWLEYTINVQEDGWYETDIKYAGTNGGSISIKIDDEFINAGSSIKLLPTVTETEYNTKTVRIGNIAKGKHTFRVIFNEDGFHLNSFEVKKVPDYDKQIVLGNPNTQGGNPDSWKSNLIVNITDVYTNESGVQEEITIKDFSFYASKKANPVTPFIGYYYGDADRIQILAIGTTRTAAEYNIGQNTFPFKDGVPKIIYLNSDVGYSFNNGTEEIYGEQIVTGFMDANANGTGGGNGGVIPFDQSGSTDQIWYLGSASGANIASIIPYRTIQGNTNPVTSLKRNYHYNINFEIKPTTITQIARIEDRAPSDEGIYRMTPGDQAQLDVVAVPYSPLVDGTIEFGTSHPDILRFVTQGGGFAMIKYVDDTPMEVYAYSVTNPEMRISVPVLPVEPMATSVPTEETILLATDFDHGDDGETFHDNNNPDPVQIIPRSAVSIKYVQSANAVVVTDIEAGEWLEYTIDVAKNARYFIDTYYAGISQGKILFEVDGIPVGIVPDGTTVLPSTGSLSIYKSVRTSIANIFEGKHVLRVNMQQGGFDLKGFKIIEDLNVFPDNIPPTIPGTVEAENFDLGGQLSSYYDVTNGNIGGQYRPESDVDILSTDEGGYAVGWMSNGEWLQYTVNVATAGAFKANVRYSTTRPQGAIRIEFDGNNKTNTITLPNTGSPQTFKTVTSQSFNLETGIQAMRIYVEQFGINIQKIDIVPVNSSRNQFTTSVGSNRKEEGINESTDLGIKIYPNPAQDILYIKGTSSDTMYTIFDIYGRKLNSGKILNGFIDFGNVSRGIYLISFNKSGATKVIQTERIIVE